MTENEFKEKKAAALAKAMPHYADPANVDLPKMTVEETALLMSPSADRLVPKSAVSRKEKSALLKLKEGFARIGVTSLADIL